MWRMKKRFKGSEATDSGEQTENPKTPEDGETVASTSRQSDGCTEQTSSSNEMSEIQNERRDKEILPTVSERPELYARVKRSGTSGYEGHEYEWNLLGLTLLRAQKAKHKFCLTSEHEDVGALDDVVLQLLNDDGTNKSTMFLQAKHRGTNSKKDTIKLNDLLNNTNKKLALNKYFNSYRQIQSKFLNDKKTIFFFGAFETCRFVIFTNNTLDSNVDTDTEIKDECNELWPLLKSGDQKIVQLKLNDESKQKLVETYVPEKGLPALSPQEYEKEFNNFLGKLYFFVDQPHHKKLLEKIEDEVETLLSDNVEISKVCRAFMDLVKEWSGKDENKVKDEDKKKEKVKVKDKTTILTQENPFLNEAILSVLTELNVQQIKNYDMQFEEAVINKLVEAITHKETSNFLNIVASQGTIPLSSIKLHQAMKTLQKSNWKTFFLTVGQLNNRVNSEKLPLFTSENTLIAYAAERTEDCQQVLTDLKRILSQNPGATFVVITEENVPGYSRIPDEFNFNHLTTESQKKLRDTEVMMQGQKTKLSQLMDTDGDECKDIFTGEVVMELINSRDGISIRAPKLLRDSNEAYVQVYKEISENNLVKALSEFTDEVLFVIHEAGNQTLTKRLNLVPSSSEAIRQAKHIIFIPREEQDVTNIFKQKCLENPRKLVYLLKMTEASFQLCEIYNPNFYHERQFYCYEKVVCRPKLLTRGIEFCKFICYGTPQDTQKLVDSYKNAKIKCTYSETDAKDYFRDECNENPNASVHLLKIEGQNLIWQRSQGSLQIIRYHIDQDLSTKLLVKESEFATIFSDKLVIIADEPGMGKSTTLTSLSQRMMDSYWVLRLDLRNCMKDIARLPENPQHVNFEIVNKFLREVEDTAINSKLSKNLLAHKLRTETLHRPILLLFDGFDEISEDSLGNNIVALVQFLKQETKANVCITTRKTHKEDLEDSLSMVAIEFEEIGEELQQEFLYKFWQLSLRLTCIHEDYEERLRTFPPILTQMASKALGDNRTHFMGIPLQLRMLAEGYQSDVTECLNDNKNLPNAELNLLGMYGKFISTKYNIYFEQKKGLPASKKNYMQMLYKGYDKLHGKLALNEFFPNCDLPVDSIENGDKNELKSVGIIQSIGTDGEIYFIHKTFAEYFIAKLLFSHLQRKDIKADKFKAAIQFLDKQKLHKKHIVIYKFLNLMLSKDSVMHRAVLEDDLALVVNTAECDHERRKDHLDRTALHLAAEMGNEDIVSFLLQNGYDASNTDNLGRTPLHYAAIFRQLQIMRHLLDYIADIDILDNIFSKPLHHDMEVGDCIFNKTEQLNSVLFNVVNALDVYGKSALIYSYEDPKLKTFQDFGEAHSPLIFNGAKISHIPFVAIDEMESRTIDALLVLKCPIVFMHIITDYKVRYENLLIFSIYGGHTLILSQILTCLTPELLKITESTITSDFITMQNFNPGDFTKCISYLFEKELLKPHDEVIDKILDYAARNNYLTIYNNFRTKGGLSLPQRVLRAIEYDRLNFLECIQEQWHNCKLNDDGDHALHVAASHGSLKIIKYLCQREDVNINICNNEDKTPLLVAAVNYKYDAIMHLIQKGALMNTIAKNVETALTIVFRTNQTDNPQYVLNICKSLAADSGISETLTSVRVMGEIVTTARHEVNKPDKDGVYLVQKAAKYTGRHFLPYLIDQGADLNVRDNEGKTALHYAAENRIIRKYNIFGIFQHLLENGCIYDARDNANNTFIKYIPQSDNDPELKVLHNIEHVFGNVSLWQNFSKNPSFALISPRTKDSNLNTLLHVAVLSGNTETCKDLLRSLEHKYKHNRFFVNKDGNTPLHIAVQNKFVQIAKLLLEEGFMNNIRNNEHQTPRDLAKRNKEITELFASLDSLFVSIKEDNLGKFQESEWRNKFKTVRNEQGQTLLHLAASLGSSNIVQMLHYRLYSWKYITDNKGRLPFHLAVKHNRLSEVKALYRFYSINFKDNDGYTPLHIAAKSDNIDMVVFLLRMNAIFNSTNNDGETPLDLAGPETKTKVLLNKITNMLTDVSDQNCPSVEDLNNFLKDNDRETFSAAINARDSNGNSLLHFAAENGNSQLVKYLLGNGVPYDIENNNYNNCPKYHSCDEETLALFQSINKIFQKDTEFVEPLKCILSHIDKTSFPNICNINGETIFVNGNIKQFKVKHLIKHYGLDINAEDKLGRTWLCHAANFDPKYCRGEPDLMDLGFYKFLWKEGADTRKLPLILKNKILQQAKRNGRLDIENDLKQKYTTFVSLPETYSGDEGIARNHICKI